MYCRIRPSPATIRSSSDPVRHGAVATNSVLDGYSLVQMPELRMDSILEWGLMVRVYGDVMVNVYLRGTGPEGLELEFVVRDAELA